MGVPADKTKAILIAENEKRAALAKLRAAEEQKLLDLVQANSLKDENKRIADQKEQKEQEERIKQESIALARKAAKQREDAELKEALDAIAALNVSVKDQGPLAYQKEQEAKAKEELAAAAKQAAKEREAELKAILDQSEVDAKQAAKIREQREAEAFAADLAKIAALEKSAAQPLAQTREEAELAAALAQIAAAEKLAAQPPAQSKPVRAIPFEGKAGAEEWTVEQLHERERRLAAEVAAAKEEALRREKLRVSGTTAVSSASSSASSSVSHPQAEVRNTSAGVSSAAAIPSEPPAMIFSRSLFNQDLSAASNASSSSASSASLAPSSSAALSSGAAESAVAGFAVAAAGAVRSADENEAILKALIQRLATIGGYTSEGLVAAKLAPDAKKAEQFISLGTPMLEKAVQAVVGIVSDSGVLEMLPIVIPKSQGTGSYKALFACLDKVCTVGSARRNSMNCYHAG